MFSRVFLWPFAKLSRSLIRKTLEKQPACYAKSKDCMKTSKQSIKKWDNLKNTANPHWDLPYLLREITAALPTTVFHISQQSFSKQAKHSINQYIINTNSTPLFNFSSSYHDTPQVYFYQSFPSIKSHYRLNFTIRIEAAYQPSKNILEWCKHHRASLMR